jgi:hypothetical protein
MTVQESKLLSERESKSEMQTTRMGPLTFNVNPQLKEDEHVYLTVTDDQAKLMCWHYRLSPLPISKLKQLALNGKIP